MTTLYRETRNKIMQIKKMKFEVQKPQQWSLRYHKNVQKVANILLSVYRALTFCSEISFSFQSFNLSTLHCILTSCPTLRPSEGRGRKPTARLGSSTGLCKIIALLKINSCLAPSTSIDSFIKGGWAPIVLSPETPYLIFNMLSGCFLASAFIYFLKNQTSRLI